MCSGNDETCRARTHKGGHGGRRQHVSGGTHAALTISVLSYRQSLRARANCNRLLGFTCGVHPHLYVTRLAFRQIGVLTLAPMIDTLRRTASGTSSRTPHS
jgi:hypothetical protein